MAKAEAAIDRDPLAFLVAPEAPAAFLAGTWEQRPAVFKATSERRAFFGGLASFSELARVARICEEEGEPLEFGVDVNAARYVEGRRETLIGKVADNATLAGMFNEEGCTMQFHQPQRFCDATWRLLAALERRLGCLVGCNAYLTPPGTQGLAPHWDDVEIFVVQTEGSKRWRLHRAPPAPDGAPPTSRASLLAHSHLANQVSGDLEPSEIGEPFMEFTLEVGDLLYMPRGTIHCATAQEGGPSGHLTISTYQRWSAADLLQFGVSVALANPSLQPLLPAPLKAGLPPGFLAAASLGPAAAAELAAGAGGFGEEGTTAVVAAAAKHAGGSKADSRAAAGDVQQLAAQLAAACRALADCLEGGAGGAGLGPRLLTTAGDAMADDFMRHRLPPHPEQLPTPGPPPSLADSVQCVGASYFRLVPMSTREGGGCGPDCEEEHDHDHGHDGHDGHAHGPACGSGCQQEDHAHGSSDKEQEEEEAGGSGHAQGGGAPPAWVRLVSCLRNDRGSHMMGGGDDEEEGSSDEEGPGSDSGSEDGGEVDAEELAARAAAAAAALGRKRKHSAAAGEGSSEEEREEEEGGSGSDDEGSDDEGDEDDEDDEGPQEDLVFPAEFAPALVQLLRTAADAGGQPLPVAAIALPDPELQLQVAGALWGTGVLRTVQAEKAKAGKKGKQAAGKQRQQQAGKAAEEQKDKKPQAAKQQQSGKAAKQGGPKPKRQRA